ncbi:hypothetical protein [Streptomyces sp. 6N223]|uniref:hypothetical protein n=1 Tax=Streptomyces sp. 6N223 TaxID=3457412 RepID=UPI003FD1E971
MGGIIGEFNFLEPEWIYFPVGQPGAPQMVSRQVAQRAGVLDRKYRRYAKALLPELKLLDEIAQENSAGPVAVYVPLTPPETRPLVAAVAWLVPRDSPDAGRTVEAIAEVVRGPRSRRFREPEIELVTLPLGPACQVKEILTVEDAPTDDGRQPLIEELTHYVLPECYPEGVIEFTITFNRSGLAALMMDAALDMANSLIVEPA